MSLIRKLYYRFRFRKRNKIYRMPKKAQEKMFKMIFPNPDTPLMELTNKINKPGAVVPDPKFKFFGADYDKDRIDKIRKALEKHDKSKQRREK